MGKLFSEPRPALPQWLQHQVRETDMANDSYTVPNHDHSRLPPRATRLPAMLREVSNLMRIRQWPKNALVFVPLILSPGAGTGAFIDSIILFFAFCGLASVVYVINDIADAEGDRSHPTKSSRPIASGAISPIAGLFLVALLLILVVALASLLPNSANFMMVGYLALNISYSFRLKRVAIVEIFCVAAGFVIRVFVGAEVAGLTISHELIAFVFFFCAFVSIGKRRREINLAEKAVSVAKHRAVLQHYNLAFLDSLLSVTVITSGVFFWLHIIDLIHLSSRPSALFTCLSALSVTALIFRYLQAIYVESSGDNPADFFVRDPFTLLSALLGGTFYWLSISTFV